MSRTNRILIAALAAALASPHSFAQTVPTTPMDRTEILGRLATEYSPSYIAHLVKTRGLSFSVTATFLDQVKQAGGAGILLDNLPHAESPNSMGSDPDAAPSVDHLANCAALIHSGDYDSANDECHAAIKESPSSPRPLLVTSMALQFVSPRFQENDWRNAVQKQQAELLQQANALMPPSPPSALPRVPPGAGGIAVTPEQTVKLAQELLDLDEANSRFAAIGELFTFKIGFELAPDAAAEPPSAATLEIPPSLQARMQIEPDLAGNHLSLAHLYDQAHDFESARNELLEAIRLEPDYESPHVQLATLYISHQDLAGAVDELREVVRIAPFGMIEGTALARTLETAGKTPDSQNIEPCWRATPATSTSTMPSSTVTSPKRTSIPPSESFAAR